MMQGFLLKDYFSRFLKFFSLIIIMSSSVSYAMARENETVATEGTMDYTGL